MLKKISLPVSLKRCGKGKFWRTATLAFLVIIVTISLAGCASTESRLNTFSVGAKPKVDVEVDNGGIELEVGEDGEITVTAELRNPDRIEYEVSQEGDVINVRADTKGNSRADVTITVPVNCEFELNTGNGEVSVTGIQASGLVNSGNGDAELEGIRGDVIANIGNGGIKLDDAEGSFILNSGNGNIVIRSAEGSFAANVGNGGITFQGEMTAGGDNTFGTGNGDVTVELAGTPSLELDLETDDGKVESDLPVTVTEQSQYRLVGTIGDGEATLTVRVGSGDITIK